MEKIIVSGSIAYDFIMDTGMKFGSSLTRDQDDNVSGVVLIDKLKKETGGTGLNIAFNLAMLGEEAILLGSVGDDFIFDGFLKEKIDLTYIHKSESLLSASAYIMNDGTNGQITAFYPGAMTEANKTSVKEIKEEGLYTIVSPNDKVAMLQHLDEAKNIGIKSFFDPGQAMGAFSGEELLIGADLADYLIVNEHEFTDFSQKTGKDELELLDYFSTIIVTLGEKGSKIVTREGVIHIPVVPAEEVVDPTGAGDAFRAGLLKGLKHEFDFETSAKIGAIVASYCVAFHGGQNHFVSKGLVEEKMKEQFGIEITI